MLKGLNASDFIREHGRPNSTAFCDDTYFTTAVHFRFQYESLTNQFDGIMLFCFSISK